MHPFSRIYGVAKRTVCAAEDVLSAAEAAGGAATGQYDGVFYLVGNYTLVLVLQWTHELLT